MFKVIFNTPTIDGVCNVRLSYCAKEFDVGVRFLGVNNLQSRNNTILVHQTLSNGMRTLANFDGWWAEIIGCGKIIDINKYCVIIIDKNDIIYSVAEVNLFQIAQIEDAILSYFNIHQIYINLGASFGGACALAFSVTSNKKIEKTVIISYTHKAYVNQILYRNIITQILENSQNRDLAVKLIQKLNVIFYRNSSVWRDTSTTPSEYLKSLTNKLPQVSYEIFVKIIQLMCEFGISNDDCLEINSDIHLIYSSSDNMYLPQQVIEFYNILSSYNKFVVLHKLISDKGHDAFLVEQYKLSKIISQIIELGGNNERFESNYKTVL